jgi:hypothetical protein
MIAMIAGIIQRYVTDPDVQTAIRRDLRQLSGGDV